jgi:hypothetical protein
MPEGCVHGAKNHLARWDPVNGMAALSQHTIHRSHDFAVYDIRDMFENVRGDNAVKCPFVVAIAGQILNAGAQDCEPGVDWHPFAMSADQLLVNVNGDNRATISQEIRRMVPNSSPKLKHVTA